MSDYVSFANVITAIAAVLISVLTERIPLVRRWWREGLDARHDAETADTIRLGLQVIMTVLAAMLAYYAADMGYLPGPAPGDDVFIPALLAALMGVFMNQGAYHLDKKFWRKAIG